MAKPEEIFHQAIEKKTGAERAAYLDGACGADAGLRSFVEKLIRAHEDSGGILDGGAFPSPSTADSPPITERPGSVIGRYKLLQEIGEGGFGVVYMAEQVEPVRRTVAVKVIKVGMDTREVVARFEAERQALAMMDHPNIAKVLDAGATGSGRPYFVMELVHGVPITEYCDANQLTSRERLELFVKVCGAIQHAHQKSVIHRDIKPTNILVTLHDGVPVPKVVDFGIAKATNVRLTEKTLFTRFRQFVGTPAYMSPEQAEMSGLDIDTRSDIYSLGILLYEMLTGTTPLDPRELLAAGYVEIQRMIREVEPPKPSTRVSTMKDEARTVVARRRKVDGSTLSRSLRGELDWIVMRAMEKDRSRRYETAMDLARDIGRHLRREPVEAGPPSKVYRLRKLVQRNKTAIAAGAAVLAALVAGLGFATWMYLRERAAHEQSVASQRTAEEEAAIKESVSSFLQDDVLKQADSREQAEAGAAPRPGLTVREAVDRAAAGIGERFQGQPLLEAEIRRTIGNTYVGLGEPKEGVPHLERAVALLLAERGPDHLGTLRAQAELAVADHGVGRLAEAVAIHKKLLAHEARLGANHPLIVRELGNYAWDLRELGKLTESLALLEDAARRCASLPVEEQRLELWIRTGLSVGYEMCGRFPEAVAVGEKTIEQLRQRLGPDHPDVLEPSIGLAWTYLRAGRNADSIALNRDLLARLEKVRGPDHPTTLGCMNNLGEACRQSGEWKEAISIHEKAQERRRKVLGPDHPATLTGMNNLALAYQSGGRYAEALPLLEEVLKHLQKQFDPDHFKILITMDSLGSVDRQVGRLEDAVRLGEAACEGLNRKLGPSHLNTLVALRNLALSYEDSGRTKDAIASFGKLVELERANLGPDHADTRRDSDQLAAAYAVARRFADAEPIWSEELDRLSVKPGRGSPEAAAAMTKLGRCLSEEGKLVEAEKLLREAVASRERSMPDHPLLYNTRSILGEALARAERFEEAERLLIDGYTGMKRHQAEMPPAVKPRLHEALERLVSFYRARGNQAEAERWLRDEASGTPTSP